MNLLLLLSALLSALTGANVGMRRPEATQAVATQAAAAQSVRVAVVVARTRPAAALPTLVASAALVEPVAHDLSDAADLWTNRRRE